ncbi:TetR/AcrR family transcriptional regulator [Terracoccus luteus]|uniref:AcrR family transcriptional regulator n=1 Tax=Terracoccus luteus TaxID=53356 RepID=A0A839PRR7_9MICO|nr:TetR/AcrR family transcriptional regulator [Terracoccus luteus]MBB2986968.1 AcrR family transcriptional regulator [Terracoccus luteus]MCP2172619.1 AcrR family transcriptional regulator [Terracoccus luteus]
MPRTTTSAAVPETTRETTREPTRGPGSEPTVDRLMAAAARAFADKGFHATTTRDIASGAGLSPAGVYVHFGSKEELLMGLSRTGHASALAAVREAVAQSPTPREQLAGVMATFSKWHAEKYEIARVVQYEHHHLTPEHHAEVLGLRKQIDAVVRGVLEAGVADGSFTIDDVGDTALALLSIAVDVARWYSPTIRRTPAQIATTNAHLALRLVGAAA